MSTVSSPHPIDRDGVEGKAGPGEVTDDLDGVVPAGIAVDRTAGTVTRVPMTISSMLSSSAMTEVVLPTVRVTTISVSPRMPVIPAAIAASRE